MLNAFASLKCSKKCQHNVQKPNHKHSFIMRPGLQTRSKYLYVDSYTLISRTHKLYSTNPCFYPPRGFPTRLKYLFYLSRTKTLCLLSNSLRSCVLPIIPLCLSRAKEVKKVIYKSQARKKKIAPDLRLPLKRLRLQKLDRAYATSIHNILN